MGDGDGTFLSASAVTLHLGLSYFSCFSISRTPPILQDMAKAEFRSQQKAWMLFFSVNFCLILTVGQHTAANASANRSKPRFASVAFVVSGAGV